MATKTFKIGEYCKGGIITAEVKGTNVTVIGKEWDRSQGTTRKASQKNANEFTRKTVNVKDTYAYNEINEFLCDLTSVGWADNVLSWIQTKTKFGEF